MTDEIQPALVWQNWKHGSAHFAGRDDPEDTLLYAEVMALRVADELAPEEGLLVSINREQIILGNDDIPKVMALANAALPDGDPRKITQADVGAIEDAAREVVALTEDASQRIAAERHATELRAIAAKLAALLPPA